MSTSFHRSVSQRLAERQETSEARRRYLQRLARLMCSRARPRVQFVNGIPTARCREDGSDFFIEIGGEVIDQTVTNLPRPVWSLVAQEGLIVHEIGHVLYTDFGAHEEIREKLGVHEMNVFHDVVFNPAEDAAIEEQLRQSFDCADELDAYNANLFERQKDHAKRVSVTDAVKIAILEKGCYDAGAVEEYRAGNRQLVEPQDESVFDDLLDEVDDLLTDVMTEPKPGERYQRMLEFWNHLCDVMQDHGQDAANEHDPNDGYSDGKPDDTTGMTDGEDADRLDDLDEDEVEEQVSQRGQPEDWDEFGEDDADESSKGESGASDGEESDEGPSPEDGDEPGETGGEDGDEAESDEAGDGGGGAGEGDGEDSDGEAGGTEGGDESGGPGDGDGDGETDSGDGAGSGSGGSPDGDDGPQFPGHEGHTLVLTD